jgi:hypothetical protein
MFQEEDINCRTLSVVKEVPKYLFSKGEERVKLSGDLGGMRIVCGIKLVQGGNVERGVYTIIKGLYYLKSHYTEMRMIVEKNRDKCQLTMDPTYERWVEGYLTATQGRVHEAVLNVYGEVERSRARVEELCMD